jgi:hypothetical protein
MILNGHSFPLPDWIKDAIIEGVLEVRVAPTGYEYLKGRARDPKGKDVTFDWKGKP